LIDLIMRDLLTLPYGLLIICAGVMAALPVMVTLSPLLKRPKQPLIL
jgi:hypothetical protein